MRVVRRNKMRLSKKGGDTMSEIMQKALTSKAARTSKKLKKLALSGSGEALAWAR
jgi:hypothetical protein